MGETVKWCKCKKTIFMKNGWVALDVRGINIDAKELLWMVLKFTLYPKFKLERISIENNGKVVQHG